MRYFRRLYVNLHINGLIASFLMLVTCTHGTETSVSSTGIEDPPEARSLRSRPAMDSKGKKCMFLAISDSPEIVRPSQWISGRCHCANVDTPTCPKWTLVSGKSSLCSSLIQNETLVDGRCVANVYFKPCFKTSGRNEFLLKCKLPRTNSIKHEVTVQKAGNGESCFEDGDCRYTEQECSGQRSNKICKCPRDNQQFNYDSSRCLFVPAADPGPRRLGVIPISVIVIVTMFGVVLLAAGIIKCYDLKILSQFRQIVVGSHHERRRRRRIRRTRSDSSRRHSPTAPDNDLTNKPPEYNELQTESNPQECPPPPSYIEVVQEASKQSS